jgi:hypothetical protein
MCPGGSETAYLRDCFTVEESRKIICHRLKKFKEDLSFILFIEGEGGIKTCMYTGPDVQ